jgi:hypothetical protein
MDIFLVNTTSGFIPAYDSDYDNKKKLKIGDIYKASIKKPRNYEFHKKYFALINCAWHYLTEKECIFFKENIESFRKTIEIQAGHFDLIYSIKRKEWVEEPKSVAFDKMDEFEFKELYDSVKDVLFLLFFKNVTRTEFEKNLKNF